METAPSMSGVSVTEAPTTTVTAQGLSTVEAQQRFQQLGPNEFPPPPRPRLILRFANQLTHFMALLLWVAGALAFIAGTPLIGIAIWSVIIINGLFGFFQEYRAERALSALSHLLPLQAKVYRDGVLTAIAARELVLGDIIEVEAGDKVPSDALLIEAEGLLVDMSSITGESAPIVRQAVPPNGADLNRIQSMTVPLQEQAHHPDANNSHTLHTDSSSYHPNNRRRHRPSDNVTMILAGTTVVSGRGKAMTVATGLHTEFGHLTRLATTAERAPNRLEVETSHIVQVITILACVMGASVFFFTFGLMGLGTTESLLLGIGILVANVPEGLLPTVSVVLALGVQRMAKNNALVRRLSAIESMSAVSVLCTDKTGTLTLNSMSVKRVWIPDQIIEMHPSAEPSPDDQSTDPSPAVAELLAAAVCCSYYRRQIQTGISPTVQGDPTEAAIMQAAFASGSTTTSWIESLEIRREFAFDSYRRLMSVAADIRSPDNASTLFKARTSPILITKGAPDSIL